MKAGIKVFFLVILPLFVMGGGIYATPAQEESSGVRIDDPRSKLLRAAEAYLGAPYRSQGLDHRGFDCSGLVYRSFMDALNMPVPRSSAGLYVWSQRIPREEMQRGDLVFFNTTGLGISHVGIYAGDGQFIHSASQGRPTGVIYSRMNEPYWSGNFVGAGKALPDSGEWVLGSRE
jgi:probable lipoprotein NlpC